MNTSFQLIFNILSYMFTPYHSIKYMTTSFEIGNSRMKTELIGGRV